MDMMQHERIIDDEARAKKKEQLARWREEDNKKAEAKADAERKEERQHEIEAAVAVAHTRSNNDLLAGGSSRTVEYAGNRVVKNFELAGYISQKITTKKGYSAMAYSILGASHPALIDYGNSINVYGANTPEDYRSRAAALVELGQKKGWRSMNFWGDEEFLRAVIKESAKAGVQPNIAGSSSYQPTLSQLGKWFQEAEAELKKEVPEAPAGGEKEAETKTEAEADPYANMSTSELVKRAQKLRRKLGVEFEDDDEQEGPSHGQH